jgi:MoaA/NifB/PqqE/SkfB family radical SAM enzyme
MTAVVKNSFCIYPWIHMQLKPNGQAKPCCRFDHMNQAYRDEKGNPIMSQYNVKEKSFKEIMESDFWNELREDMLKGKTIPGCYKCDKEDAGDKFSMRFNANNAWNEQNEFRPIDVNQELSFKYLELTTGRYCNLACRMCSSDLSTTWDADDKVLAEHYKDRFDFSKRPQILDLNFTADDFKETQLIKMTGGEPMIVPTFIPFIDKVIESGYTDNIMLQIYTNCSWVPKSKIIDRLKKFGLVQIYLSIDGLDEVNDYIRYPSKWTTVEESAKKWLSIAKEHNNFDIVFSPTISLYNILQLPKMWNWWESLQEEMYGEKFIVNSDLYSKYTRKNKHGTDVSYIYEIARFSPTMLQTPNYLTSTMLPQKQQVIDQLEEIIQRHSKRVENLDEYEIFVRFRYMIKHIISSFSKDTNNSLQDFVEYSADVDKLRDQKLQDSLPELWNQIQGYVEYKGKIT